MEFIKDATEQDLKELIEKRKQDWHILELKAFLLFELATFFDVFEQEFYTTGTQKNLLYEIAVVDNRTAIIFAHKKHCDDNQFRDFVESYSLSEKQRQKLLHSKLS